MKATWLKLRLVPIATLALAIATAGVIRASTEQDTDATELPGVIEHLLGKQADRDDQARCEMRATDTSYLGLVNDLSCALNALGINGATGAAGVTKTLNTHRGSFVVHIQVNQGAMVGTTAYDWEALVWGCSPAAADCTLTASFQPISYWAFSASADHSINKGAIAHYIGLHRDGTTVQTGSLRIVYDIGTATVPTDITAFVYDTKPSFDREKLSTAGLLIERNEVQRNGTMLDLTQLAHTSMWDRVVSIAMDTAANTGGYYMEGNFQTLPPIGTAAAGTTPKAAACFMRQANAEGNDFDFVIDPANTSCTVAALPAYSETNLVNETQTTVATFPGTAQPLNGMPANPPSL